MTNANSHEFALYVPDLNTQIKNNKKTVTITDDALMHRIIHVLRIEMDQSLILFDQKIHAVATVIHIQKKKSVEFAFDTVSTNVILQPVIRVMLPLLKKESLETALYGLTEVGVTEIQLVMTHKSQQRWSEKDHERAQRIIIAAAEQSKHFNFPTLYEPIPFDAAIEKESKYSLFLDPAGISASEYIPALIKEKPSEITLFLGPEGDVTPDEKAMLKKKKFHFYALTPTILRACQAAVLGAGILRAIF